MKKAKQIFYLLVILLFSSEVFSCNAESVLSNNIVRKAVKTKLFNLSKTRLMAEYATKWQIDPSIGIRSSSELFQSNNILYANIDLLLRKLPNKFVDSNRVPYGFSNIVLNTQRIAGKCRVSIDSTNSEVSLYSRTERNKYLIGTYSLNEGRKETILIEF